MSSDNRKQFNIKIDRDHYKVDSPEMTGVQLRALADPDIGADLDLWLEGRGGEADRKIEDDDIVDLANGLHFFSASRTINPGCADS